MLLLRQVRFWWILAAFLSGAALAMIVEDLRLEWRDNKLEFAAPRLHFLAGKPLERLKNAAEVPFDIQITLWSGSRNHLLRQSVERFVVSYDLWEETFSVVKTQAPARRMSHLNAGAAERWCLSQMTLLDLGGLSRTEPIWAKLDVRAQESGPERGKSPPLPKITDSGISLNALIEIFSRPPKAEQPHWTLEAGPVTLDGLTRVQRPF